MEILSGPEVGRLHPSFKPLAGLKIRYFDPKGKPLSDWPKAPPFYRIRYLEEETGFAAQTRKKPLRYVQEPGTLPVAYYPRNQKWDGILENTDFPIILTEGELKAAKACKEGFPTIGLGGVYNWKSIKNGIDWLPSLDFVKWLRRHVYICFDSDYRTNPMVCSALFELAEALQDRGAFAHLTSLPELSEREKVGLDDFFVDLGPQAHDAFEQLLHDADPLGLTSPLWELNRRYVYVQDPGLVVNYQTFQKMSPSAFRDHAQSTLVYQERRLMKDGRISYEPVSAAGKWIRWPLRQEATCMTYRPGAERFLGNGQLNIWPGWGVKPVEGDIEPFLQLIHHLFIDVEPEAKHWFLKWLAYPLQYPGTKLFSSVVVHGIKHGTGKSLIGYTMGKIYGKNFTEINHNDLFNSNFTEWAESKQFVMGDDITGSDKRHDNDFLKKLITQKEMRINTKFIPSYTVPDCINYYFTANQPDSFFLEDDDRRFFIHEVVVGPLPEEFYVDYGLWLETGGAEAVFWYLLNLDLEDFNPAAPAFRTAAKQRMIETARSDLAGWVRMLMEAPESILKVGGIKIKKDLFSARELLMLYDPMARTGTTSNGMKRELKRAGFREVCGGKGIRLSDGTVERYFAIRNATHWLYDKGVEDIAVHLEQHITNKAEKKY